MTWLPWDEYRNGVTPLLRQNLPPWKYGTITGKIETNEIKDNLKRTESDWLPSKWHNIEYNNAFQVVTH